MTTDEPASTDETSTDEPNTDEPNTDEPNTDEPVGTESAPVRRASPTSRARRIGGLSRPAPGTQRRPEPTASSDAETGAANYAPSVDLSKVSSSEASPPDAAGSGAPDVAESTSGPGRPAAEVAAEVPAWLRWLPAAALGLAAVVMLVFFLIVSHGVWWARPSAQAVREQVLAAAKTCTVATNSWHFNSFAADEAKGVACTTGSRTSDYKNAMEHVIKPLAVKLQASQVAQVNYAGISDVSVDGGSWNILIVGQLTIRQQTNPQGRQDPFAALIRMDRVHGQWLMARIQEVAGPAAR